MTTERLCANSNGADFGEWDSLAIRLIKPWQRLTAEAVRGLPGQLGVFQLGNADGTVIYIGYAGGRSLFGLRSAVDAARVAIAGATQFRHEITMQYLSRYKELLMLHVADNGKLPAHNRDAPTSLGRLSPL
jgi:hypothetical protein